MKKDLSLADAIPALLRKMNFRKVLDAMHVLGPCSRAQLTRETGISPPTMSILVRELVKRGLVEKDKKVQSSAVGRPGILFRLAQKASFVASIVLDSTMTRVCANGLNGVVRPGRVVEFPTPQNDYDALIQQVAGAVSRLATEENGNFLGIGICTPGLVDQATGTVTLAANLPLLNGHTPAADLQRVLQKPVAMLPEVHAMTLAAKIFGRAGGARDFLLFDLTNGTGMGAFHDGRYLSGAHGYGAEMGHITVVPENGLPCGCGNTGCLETVANDRALARECSARAGREMDIEEVIRRVNAGELQIEEALDKTLSFLAIGVAAAINLFNPALVILQGRIFDLHPEVLPRLVEKIRKRALAPSMAGVRIETNSPDKQLAAVATIVNHIYSAASH